MPITSYRVLINYIAVVIALVAMDILMLYFKLVEPRTLEMDALYFLHLTVHV